jgi:hypothetical protein
VISFIHYQAHTIYAHSAGSLKTTHKVCKFSRWTHCCHLKCFVDSFMHNIIRDGAVESQFASENDGSRHGCANEQVQAKKNSPVIAKKIASISYSTS